MRSIILTIAPVMLSTALSAQGVFSNKTQSILEKVIQDYPNRFNNIKGEQILQTRQTTEYRCTLQLPGSSSSTITRHTAARFEDYSWFCTVFESGNFEQAKNKFREVYAQIKNCIITAGGQKTFILTGQYEDPGDDKPAHVVFSLLPGVGDLKKVKVELSLREEPKGWKITLSVYDGELKEGQGEVTAN